MDLSSVVQ